jgi:hypothetical protein
MSIFDMGSRAVQEWAKEEIVDLLTKGIQTLIEDNPDWGLDEQHALDKQKKRILKFLNVEIINGIPRKNK